MLPNSRTDRDSACLIIQGSRIAIPVFSELHQGGRTTRFLTPSARQGRAVPPYASTGPPCLSVGDAGIWTHDLLNPFAWRCVHSRAYTCAHRHFSSFTPAKSRSFLLGPLQLLETLEEGARAVADDWL